MRLFSKRYLLILIKTDWNDNMHPVIKWSGSKRSQADEILKYVPKEFNTYYEPFIGGGSILYTLHPQKAICGDIYEPLINLWKEIQDNPVHIINDAKSKW